MKPISLLCVGLLLLPVGAGADDQGGLQHGTSAFVESFQSEGRSPAPESALGAEDQTDGTANAFWDVGANVGPGVPHACELIIFGEDNGDLFAAHHITGDINGDGIPDLIAGAPEADGAGNARSGCGAVYIFYGGGGMMGQILTAADADVVIHGRDVDDGLGEDMACDDINGDSQADLIIGCYATAGRDNLHAGAGEVYVFFGGSTFASVIDLSSSSADVEIYGPTNPGSGTYWAQAGVNVAVGNINGDAYRDLLIYASTDENGCGTCGVDLPVVRVFYGTASWPTQLDMDTDYDVRLTGETTFDGLYVDPVFGGTYRSTRPLAAVDMNCDGYDDVCMILAGGDGPGDAFSDIGELCITYGGPSLASELYFSGADVIAYGEPTDVMHLVDLTPVDINPGGCGDLYLHNREANSAGGTRTGGGMGGVLFNSGTLPASTNFWPSADIVFHGAETLDRLTWATSIDLDGNGVYELVVNSYGGDGPNNTHMGANGFGCGDPVIINRPDLLPPFVDLAFWLADVKLFSSFLDIYVIGNGESQPFCSDITGDGVPDLSINAPASYDFSGNVPGCLILIDGSELLNVGNDADLDAISDDCDPCPNDFSIGAPDLDMDGLPDVCDPDIDNDGVDNASDPLPTNTFVCGLDADADGCDDCLGGGDGFGPLPNNNPNNDGPDVDSDGICDSGDPDDDNDGVPDLIDPLPFLPTICGDSDGDGCDDCTNQVDGFGPLSDFDPSNDGPDLDGDGLCDSGDPDDDNDGVLDANDSDPADPSICEDVDNDGCDDCSAGVDGFGPANDNDPANDGTDTDADGICDLTDNCLTVPNPGQEDTDGDGIGDACQSTGCCVLRVGDANGIGGDEPTIGDASSMIDAKYITGACAGILDCLTEADVNQSGGTAPTCDDITIGDISTLVDYLYITGPSLGLPNCL